MSRPRLRRLSPCITLLPVGVLALTTMAACRTPGGQGSSVVAIEAGAPIEVESKLRLDLAEVSGLGLVPTNDGASATVYAIGDKKKALARLSFSSWNADPEISVEDLAPLLGGGSSQWEGVAADGAGTVVILRENPGQLFVLRDGGATLARTITLDTSTFSDGDDDNSLGEGLALLGNGNILYLKEKNPGLLIEYGPEGAAASGVAPGTLLPAGAAWPSAEGGDETFVPLKVWVFGGSTQELLWDFSDLAVGPNGTLYVLSDESRRIGQLEASILPEDGKVKIVTYWDLPSSVDKPEGLAFLGDHPIVSSDQGGGKNIYVLKKL